MSIKNIILSTISVLLLYSCGDADPVKYNDNLVQHTTKSEALVKNLDAMVQQSFNDKEFLTIANDVNLTLDSLAMERTQIENLKTPQGARNYQNMALAYIRSLEDETYAYLPYASVSNDTPKGIMDKMDDVLLDKQKKVLIRYKEMEGAKISFTLKNGIVFPNDLSK